jgi:beta-galactosidase
MKQTERFAPHIFLHGGDYNPDQWLDRPEILEEDIRLMKEAHVNEASIGIFAWAKEEPKEGKYDLEWLAQVINRLYKNGIYTILATPTGALPHWMTEKYPEVLKVDEHGIRRIHGQRHNFCPSSPVLRKKMQGINEELSRRFGRHPGVIAWHLSNEYGGDNDAKTTIGCHCPYCEENFRKFLKARYGTLDALNKAWWTGFWSNIFTDWNQIHCPGEGSEHTMHGIKLDYKRFVSAQMLDFCKAEAEAVRKYSDRPVCSNLMGAFEPLDYFKWARELDFVSIDSYPDWHHVASARPEDQLPGGSVLPCDAEPARITAFNYALTRSLKKQPFLLMESTPSMVNWKSRNPVKRPGMHELSSLQAVANGSDSVQYFQWRKSLGSSEKLHGAVVGHMYGADTRVFRDVARLGERLETLAPKVLGTVNKPKAALLFDWENMWAVNDAQAVVQPFGYQERMKDWFKPFFDMGIDCDIVDMDSDISDYRLLAAPYNYMYKPGWAEKVREFVQKGGIFVTTVWSGIVNESDRCFEERHPLADVLGIRPEETDTRPPFMKNWIRWREEGEEIPERAGRKHPLYEVRDLAGIVGAESAEVLATYTDDFYADSPALTMNRFGEGCAYYAAAEGDTAFVKALLVRALSDAGIECPLEARLPEPEASERPWAKLPHGVTVSMREKIESGASTGDNSGARSDDPAGTLLFVQNFNARPVEILLKKAYRNAENGQICQDGITLEKYQCLVLEEL